ncbi:MAG TPA: ISKra4 family transposase [Polyangia bacterium]|jgi:hypothetical protein
MDSTSITSSEWLKIACAAYAQTDGTAPAMIAALRAHWATEPSGLAAATAFAEGVAELARYATQLPGETADAVDVEAEAVVAARRVVRPLLQAKLQARLDALEARAVGATVCPGCGQTAESQGRRSRRWSSVLGPLSLQRRYAYCEQCGQGIAPAQVALGLPAGDYTPRLEEVCTMMATTVPHAMATGLVAKLCGIDISVKAMEDMTERRAAQVEREAAREAARCAPFDATGLPVPSQARPADAIAAAAAPKVAYLEVDGVVPITREELTGKELTPTERRRQRRAKKAKAHGGKGCRYRIIGREVKNAVLYDGKDCATESPGRGCILRKTYVSYLGDWGTFAGRVWVEMLRQRFDQAKLLVILSDGADWVRSLARWLPLEVFLILDLFHVKHRLWEVANSLYGEKTPKARAWAETQCGRIEDGGAKAVISALRFLRPGRRETRKLVAELAQFLDNNLDRMDYPTYRARGLRVSSGTVESANYHVTGTRLKLQGMRWSAEGAGHMAALRADLFNGRWEQRTKELLAA